VRLNRQVGCRYHAQHLSSGESVEIIRRARETGQPVTGEASPHHLLLTDETCEDLGTAAKMNPPLRTARDIALIKEGIASGVITVLATDHAPHPVASKAVDFAHAAFGIVGVECALPLYIKALVDDGVLDWPGLIAMMTMNPARLIGIDAAGLGTLAIGGEGDVTIIEPDIEWTIDIDAFVSTGRNCPFDGWTVRGRAIGSIVGGRVKRLMEAGRVVAAPGPVAGLDG
jgi:dihydroorotase